MGTKQSRLGRHWKRSWDNKTKERGWGKRKEAEGKRGDLRAREGNQEHRRRRICVRFPGDHVL